MDPDRHESAGHQLSDEPRYRRGDDLLVQNRVLDYPYPCLQVVLTNSGFNVVESVLEVDEKE